MNSYNWRVPDDPDDLSADRGSKDCQRYFVANSDASCSSVCDGVRPKTVLRADTPATLKEVCEQKLARSRTMDDWQRCNVDCYRQEFLSAKAVVLQLSPAKPTSRNIAGLSVDFTCSSIPRTEDHHGSVHIDNLASPSNSDDCSQCVGGKVYYAKIYGLPARTECDFQVQFLGAGAEPLETGEVKVFMLSQGCQGKTKCCKGPNTQFGDEFSYFCEDRWRNLLKTCSAYEGASAAKSEDDCYFDHLA